ncbi:hypothetical protein [Bradyrhizobium sp. SSUT77]|uniref:hypothetical protein n=1 Tax=Bradyrhizobium sp. SSUT77 TaxID=3040603 RepID=UPI00244A1C1A|nr:hypothetical protein [Bradyrhizobium sp. SSUT77]MDH2342904.1 hypothetical protein [Bradyrhizobium sp. SSUT77]
MRELAHNVGFCRRFDAGEIRSLPEIQARIDALLATGMTTSAAKFIHDERGKQRFGKALGRALARLHADLRLFLCTRGQVSAGTAGYELANSASGLSDLHATARRS